MKKMLLLGVMLVASLAHSPVAHAIKMNNKLGYVYGAAGLLLGLPSSVRIGRNSLELGLIAPQSVGVGGILRGDASFVTLGFSASLSTKGLGVYMGVGLERRLFLPFLTIRGEILGAAHHNGTIFGNALLGIVLHI